MGVTDFLPLDRSYDMFLFFVPIAEVMNHLTSNLHLDEAAIQSKLMEQVQLLSAGITDSLTNDHDAYTSPRQDPSAFSSPCSSCIITPSISNTSSSSGGVVPELVLPSTLQVSTPVPFQLRTVTNDIAVNHHDGMINGLSNGHQAMTTSVLADVVSTPITPLKDNSLPFQLVLPQLLPSEDLIALLECVVDWCNGDDVVSHHRYTVVAANGVPSVVDMMKMGVMQPRIPVMVNNDAVIDKSVNPSSTVSLFNTVAHVMQICERNTDCYHGTSVTMTPQAVLRFQLKQDIDGRIDDHSSGVSVRLFRHELIAFPDVAVIMTR